MIEAQHRLLTEGLKVDHLRLVIGTSMGGMHTWLWGELTRSSWTPCCPWRPCRPRFRGGTGSGGGSSPTPSATTLLGARGYRSQPPSLRTAAEMLFFMGNNPVERQKEAPTREAADRVLDDYVGRS